MELVKRTIFFFLLPLTVMSCSQERFLRHYSLVGSNIAESGSVMMRWEWGKKKHVYQFLLYPNRCEITFDRLINRTVELTYREYSLSENSTRRHLAYSEGIRADLFQNDTISFREIRIKVDSVAADIIVFKVLQESNLMRQLSQTNPDN
jgi:hypothetical protein